MPSNKMMIKTYSDTFIYKKYDRYEEELFKYLMKADSIDKNSEMFRDAIHEVKRRATSPAYVNCMESNNVVFLHGNIFKPFLVLTAKDIRKVHEQAIDMSNFVFNESDYDTVNDIVVFDEEKLSTKERKDFGIPELKKYPMPDKEHVLAAIRMFNKVDPDYEEELARNINKKIKKYNLNPTISSDNKFAKYYKPVKVEAESFLDLVPYYRQKYPNKILTEAVDTSVPLKVFVNVDVYEIFHGNTCKEPEKLIALLSQAIVNLIYYKQPQRLNSSHIKLAACTAYTKLFENVVDYLFKISINQDIKDKCEYLIAKFFQKCVLQVEMFGLSEKAIDDLAMKISGINDRTAKLLDSSIDEEDYSSIKTFIPALGKALRIDLTLDAFVDKYMYLYGGPMTAFGLEYFPSFSALLTDAYSGCYLNNQKTIEKICGKDMVDYVKSMLELAN